MWRSPMWQGLLRWCENDPEFHREVLIRRAARTEIRQILSSDHLPGLTAGEFSRRVATKGCVRHPDGTPLESRERAQIDPERLKNLLDTNRLVVTGNPMLVGDAPPSQDPLPGLDGEGLERLRASLDELLGASRNALGEAIERVGTDNSPLTERLAAQVLSLCSRTPRVIRDDVRVLGLQRLGMLLGAGRRWAGFAGSYEPLNACPLYTPPTKPWRHKLTNKYFERIDPQRFDLPVCTRVYKQESVCLHHNVLMGTQADMDLMLEAIQKIYGNADELK